MERGRVMRWQVQFFEPSPQNLLPKEGAKARYRFRLQKFPNCPLCFFSSPDIGLISMPPTG